MSTETPEVDTWAATAHKWGIANRRKYCLIHTSKVTPVSDPMPEEYPRKLVRDRGDMRSPEYRKERVIHISALRYLPYAILKLWENIPMPWELERRVNVVFHTAGALTLITDTPHVIPPVYAAQWGAMWRRMRKEKSLRAHFLRAQLSPVFDDEEPPIDYGDVIRDLPPPEALAFELADQEDSMTLDLLKDPIRNGPGRRWAIPIQNMMSLYRENRVLQSDLFDPNSFYLFDKNSFFTAKALGVALPGGPKFEPLFRDDTIHKDWNEFNDLNKVIFRGQILTEYEIAFPHFYHSRPRKVESSVYHQPAFQVLRNVNPALPTYTYDPRVFPIPYSRSSLPKQLRENQVGAPAPSVLAPISPFFLNITLDVDDTSEAFELLWASPFLWSCRGITQRLTDMTLVRAWCRERCPHTFPTKVRISYQKLLKQITYNDLKSRKQSQRGRNARHTTKVPRRGNFKQALIESKYFQCTNLDWLEAGLQLCRQAHNMLSLLLQRRNFDFLHLDYNFHLKPVKALTTKERKRSRLGPAFHIPREFMGLTKTMIDLHVKHRLGEIDAYQLADGLHFIFTHIGKLTGLYRYKYRSMRQVKWTKHLKHVIYNRFNTGPVGKGPGMGFWEPAWRIWLAFLRGSLTLLQNYVSKMLSREFEGRKVQGGALKRVTKQRVESNYDLELRESISRELEEMLPPGIRETKIRLVLQHFSEAWRRRKSNQPWRVPGLAPNIDALIRRFVKQKEDWWVSAAYYNREKLIKGQVVDKVTIRKNHGRLVRLQLKSEADRQRAWITDGPYLTPDDFTGLYTMVAQWLSNRHFQPIPFPPVNYKHDMKILRLALDKLKENHGAPGSRTTSSAKMEQLKIEAAFNNPQSTINGIKRKLMQMRSFKEMTIEYVDFFSYMLPEYEIDPDEKIVDAYLTQYLFYEAGRRQLFPSWVKPSDDLPNPAQVYNWCQTINNLPNIWDTSSGDHLVYVETQLEGLADKMECSLLSQLLCLVTDKYLADYMIARNNALICYKDMSHTNTYGLLRGLQFAPFLYQLWGLMLDLTILGLPRAAELDSDSIVASSIFDETTSQEHHIKLYLRYLDKVHIVYRFSAQHVRDLLSRFRTETGQNKVEMSYNAHNCWPYDMRMRLLNHDVRLGRSTFSFLQNRLPQTLVSMSWEKTYISVYSTGNPYLHFCMNGFELCIQPRCRMPSSDLPSEDQNVWDLIDQNSKMITAQAFLQISEEEVKQMEVRIRLILLNSGQTPFKKLIEKWNTQLAAFLVYYREAIHGTSSILHVLQRGERQIQNRVKIQLNSKMSKRFPPVLFYAPTDLWGLGMFSVGNSWIPQRDMRYAQYTLGEITHFQTGLIYEKGLEIPNLVRYIAPWQDEMRESARVWREYKRKLEEATLHNRRIVLEDINEIRRLGVPRISTAFQADKQTLLYDVGWRVRQEFKVYNVQRPQPFWYMNVRHDGRLFSFEQYKGDIVQAFGGIQSILSHSLFEATGFESWESLDWNRISKFEETMKGRKISHAQRGGLSKIPNQRFALWWSPTLNRSSVYMGFLTQIDLTGIQLQAKLPLVKASLVQIFQNHLWQKIHEGIVGDLSKAAEAQLSKLGVEHVEKGHTAPRKSLRLSSGAADIILTTSRHWNISRPSLLEETGDRYSFALSKKFWIDVQLRWGDYDSHDADQYARSKFLTFTTDRGEPMYPGPIGMLIVFDLAYNTHSAYGSWFPGFKDFLLNALTKIQRHNTELYRLRSNINSKLQLAPLDRSEPPLTAQNCEELFTGKSSWIVDGSCAYLALPYRTFEGNLSTKAVNGAIHVLDPKTGKLFFLVIHADTWKGQRRLSVLAKLKVAESVAALIRSLPKEECPKIIISMQRHLQDVLSGNLTGLPNTIIKGSNLLVPMKALLKVPKLRQLATNAVQSESHMVYIYDDWLNTVSPVTAFYRLVILLRALHVHENRTRTILQQVKVSTTSPPSHHLWPSFATNEWLTVETSLKDLIVADYCKRNGVDVMRITPTEVRDILLGQEISSPSLQQEGTKKTDTSDALEPQKTAMEIVTPENGQEDFSKTLSETSSSLFLQEPQNNADWKQRALEVKTHMAVFCGSNASLVSVFLVPSCCKDGEEIS